MRNYSVEGCSVATRSYDQSVKLLKKLFDRLRNRFLATRGGDDEQYPFNYPLFSAFGLARDVRFSFALGDDDLREGINRLASFANG